MEVESPTSTPDNSEETTQVPVRPTKEIQQQESETLSTGGDLASSPGLFRLSGVVCHVHPVDSRGIARVCVAH